MTEEQPKDAVGEQDDLDNVELHSSLGGYIDEPEPEQVEEVPEPTSEQVEPEVTEHAEESAAPQRTLEEVEREAQAFYRKSQEEKRKRQELERQIRQQQAEPKADFFDDPDKRMAQETTAVQNSMLDRMVAMSEAQARNRHADYAEKEAFFVENLQDQGVAAYNSADPGEFLYQAAKKAMVAKELGDIGSIEALRDKIRAEEKARLDAEINKRVEAKLAEAAGIPPLAGDTAGKMQGTVKPDDLDLSLEQILGR